MTPTLLPHRITEVTEVTALFAYGYDPDWDMALVTELTDGDGVDYLAGAIASVLSTLLDKELNTSYLKLVN